MLLLLSVCLYPQKAIEDPVIEGDGSVNVRYEHMVRALENVSVRDYRISNLNYQLENRKLANNRLVKSNESCITAKGAIQGQFDRLAYQSGYQADLIKTLRSGLSSCELYSSSLEKQIQQLKRGSNIWTPLQSLWNLVPKKIEQIAIVGVLAYIIILVT